MSSLYSQLEFSHPDKQIRLLRLEPSPTGTDEYAFSMKVHDFRENTRPSYIAVSYTWGLPVPRMPLVINGSRIRVQLNCWYALWQMRYHKHVSSANFWIDSLCINQSDDEEKGHQVAMMGDIYSSASSVAASLGTGESLGNVQHILASKSDHKIAKLRDRFDRLPYFKRVWIIQEIVLAKDITFFYGFERLSWSEFVHVVNARAPHTAYYSDTSGRSSNAFMVHDGLGRMSISSQLCHHRSQVAKPSTFTDLVARYSTTKASVAADKIYALLSLLPRNDPIRQNLPVIYGQSTWFPLFRDLAKLLFSHYQDEHVGDKHRTLCLIRDTLNISGLDREAIAFLKSQTCSPSNFQSFHQECATVTIVDVRVLHEEDSIDLLDDELRLTTNQTEPVEIVEKLGLFGHDGHGNQEYGSEGRSGRGIDRAHPKLHIPSELKSLRTLYTCQDLPPRRFPMYCGARVHISGASTHPTPKPIEDFLVNSDVRPGDVLAYLSWDVSEFDDRWAFAHVILRRITAADESKDEDCHVSLEYETSRGRTRFFLHSWAIPISHDENLAILSGRDSRQTPFDYSEREWKRDEIVRLNLHYRDALIPLLLNHHPLQSLLYVNSALNSGGTDFLSRVKNPKDLVGWQRRLYDSGDSSYEYACGDPDDNFDTGSRQMGDISGF